LQGEFKFAAAFFSMEGVPQRVLELPKLSQRRESPTGIAITPAGFIWALYGAGAMVFTGHGELKKSINTGGAVTAEGYFVSNGPPFALYRESGELMSGLDGLEEMGRSFLCCGGRDNVVIAPSTIGSLPEPVGQKIRLWDVLVVSTDTRRIELEDRIVIPATVLDRSGPNPDADGLPIKSMFTSVGLGREAPGDCYLLEHTPDRCRVHSAQRIDASGAGWRRKFTSTKDLSNAELDYARAEYMMRARKPGKAGALAEVFGALKWSADNVPADDALLGTDEDQAYKSLNMARASAR
jgi:hypothetical protein